MDNIIIRILLTAAFLQLGLSAKDFDLSSVSSLKNLRRASLQVLKIDWKPISVWPEDAVKFSK